MTTSVRTGLRMLTQACWPQFCKVLTKLRLGLSQTPVLRLFWPGKRKMPFSSLVDKQRTLTGVRVQKPRHGTGSPSSASLQTLISAVSGDRLTVESLSSWNTWTVTLYVFIITSPVWPPRQVERVETLHCKYSLVPIEKSLSFLTICPARKMSVVSEHGRRVNNNTWL